MLRREGGCAERSREPRLVEAAPATVA
jgi:hypothetical protein